MSNGSVAIASGKTMGRNGSAASRAKAARARAAKRPPMPLDRQLQIIFATLVSLGTMLLGMGQRNFTLTMVTMLAAGISIYVTDVRGWIRLNRPIANLAAILAVVFSVSNFFHVTSEEQLLAVANLLVYLQVVLMFQRKTGRMYWQLLMLNVLQVVVGAALDLDMLFGVLLVVYLFVALAAMNLLFIQRESERWQRIAERGARGERRGARGESQTDGFATDNGSGFRKLRSHIPIPDFSKQSLSPLAPSLSPLPPRPSPLTPIRVAVVLPSDAAGEMLGGGVFRRTFGIGVGTLIVAAICFFSLPRFGRSMWTGSTNQRNATIGYSPDVKLGDLGPMLQNPELVMRLKFRNESTNEEIVPTTSPLLRGSLVTHYFRGEWKHALADSAKPALEPLQAIPTSRGLPLVCEQITVEPMPDPVLFAVYPAYEANPDRRIMFDTDRQQLVRIPEVQWEEFNYEVLTLGFSAQGQSRILPQTFEMETSELNRMLTLPDEASRPSGGRPGAANPNANPVDRLTGLRALAEQTIRDAKLAPHDRYGQAKAIERMLSSPPFAYSLNRPPPAPDIDPIEDFATRNHVGHCEYFASALALMLRSQGIPARLVIGFRGGAWNPLGSFLDIRQLHAHAWVEAYLRQSQIPPNLLPKEFSTSNGAWLVLDSTPASGASAELTDDSWLDSFEDLSDYVAQLWNSYIVGLNSDRQQRAIYQPLAQLGLAIKGAWLEVEFSASGLAQRIGHFWGRSDTGYQAEAPLWPIELAIVALAIMAIGLFVVVRRMLRCGRTAELRTSGSKSSAPQIPFYQRFESLLARKGIVRRSGQTQRELAQAAAALSDSPGGEAARELAGRIVDVFYRVRFGGMPLDSRQADAVEQLLDRLQAAVAGRK